MLSISKIDNTKNQHKIETKANYETKEKHRVYSNNPSEKLWMYFSLYVTVPEKLHV